MSQRLQLRPTGAFGVASHVAPGPGNARATGRGPAARLRSGANRRYCWRGGRLAQLVERHVYTVDVGGSSPSPPTRKTRDLHDAPRGLAVVLRLLKVTRPGPPACGAWPFPTGIPIPLRIPPAT